LKGEGLGGGGGDGSGPQGLRPRAAARKSVRRKRESAGGGNRGSRGRGGGNTNQGPPGPRAGRFEVDGRRGWRGGARQGRGHGFLERQGMDPVTFESWGGLGGGGGLGAGRGGTADGGAGIVAMGRRGRPKWSRGAAPIFHTAGACGGRAFERPQRGVWLVSPVGWGQWRGVCGSAWVVLVVFVEALGGLVRGQRGRERTGWAFARIGGAGQWKEGGGGVGGGWWRGLGGAGTRGGVGVGGGGVGRSLFVRLERRNEVCRKWRFKRGPRRGGADVGGRVWWLWGVRWLG